MWCLIVIVLVAGSAGLSAVANTGTLGRALVGLTISAALVALCWRIFERVLWMRFPTNVEHTLAWRFGAIGVSALVAIQAVLVALGV